MLFIGVLAIWQQQRQRKHRRDGKRIAGRYKSTILTDESSEDNASEPSAPELDTENFVTEVDLTCNNHGAVGQNEETFPSKPTVA